MNPRTLRHSLVGPLVVLACLAPAAVRAVSPRDEVLRLVPDDAGFCIVVQDLRGHADEVANSPFMAEIQKSPLGTMIHNGAELKQLLDIQKKLEQAFKFDLAKLRDDVFGDAVVFAYRPGTAADPKAEQDLLLIRARDPKLLADLVDAVNKAQKESGDLKELEPREHRERKYFRRVEKSNENFVYLHGPVLVISSKEAALKDAIDRDVKAADGEPALAARLRGLGVDKAFMVFWLNPAVFESQIAARVAEAKEDQPSLKTFHQCWKALDDVAVVLDLKKDVEVSVAAKASMDKLPAGVRRFLTAAAKPSDLWARFPEDALLACAGRFDAAALFDALGEFVSDEERKSLRDGLERSLGAALGQSVVNDILPSVGPDWGFYVTAPPAADKAWFPHVLAAVRVSPGDKTPPVDKALFTALDSYALLAVLDYNRQHKDQLVLKTANLNGVDVKYLINDQFFPAGLQPAYGLHNGYLMVGSSPDALRRFMELRPVPQGEGEEFPLLRMSFKELRKYVKDRREPLSQAIADNNQITKPEAVTRLEGLLLGLQLFERVELVQRPGKGQTVLTLRLQTAKPLRK